MLPICIWPFLIFDNRGYRPRPDNRQSNPVSGCIPDIKEQGRIYCAAKMPASCCVPGCLWLGSPSCPAWPPWTVSSPRWLASLCPGPVQSYRGWWRLAEYAECGRFGLVWLDMVWSGLFWFGFLGVQCPNCKKGNEVQRGFRDTTGNRSWYYTN